ncbi:MAG: acetyl-CoA carboxylase biotin carboxyl carrier protein subunit [Leptonema sp. (in: bacteria)]
MRNIVFKDFKDYLEILIEGNKYQIYKKDIVFQDAFVFFKGKWNSESTPEFYVKVWIQEDSKYYYLKLNGRDFKILKSHLKANTTNVKEEIDINIQEVRAPLPGTVTKVYIHKDQKVKKGDLLLIIESMKMENQIFAPKEGIVEEIYVNFNEKVDTNQLLLKFKN